MNEETTTKDLPDKRSFEERVFARFDAMDARFEVIDKRFEGIDRRFDVIDKRFEGVYARLDVLEVRLQRLEARSHDTKPIWERALAAITQTNLDVGEIKTRVAAIETRVAAVESRLGTVEGDVAALRSDYASFLESQRDFKVKIVRRIDLVLETLVDIRENMRNSDARLTLLESKLA